MKQHLWNTFISLLLSREKWRKVLIAWFNDDVDDDISDGALESDASIGHNYDENAEKSDASSSESEHDTDDGSLGDESEQAKDS